MRVLAGIYKSKKIETINNTDTRPMMSKVREAIFNSIQFMVEEKDILVLIVKNSMESAMKLKVPIVVDYGFGKNWYEAH